MKIKKIETSIAKKVCCGLLVSAMVITGFPQGIFKENEKTAYAESTEKKYTVGNSTYTYTVYGDTVTITDYEGTDTEIVIPYEIEGKKVVEIGRGAFYECSSLTEISIPDSVTNIEWGAFSGCSSLTEISIPDSVTSIGDGAFSRCSGLAEISIPNSVTSIGESAFFYCSSLTEISIPDSVTNIEWGAFSGCSSLTEISIPDSVTSIGDGAFSYCRSLTEIPIPDSVMSIGREAFYECSSLTKISIPDSVTSIGDGAFWDCRSLTEIAIPDSVTSIGSYAFSRCSNLTEISIPDSVTSIGGYAFSRCSNLTIYGRRGSYAQTYAEEYYIPFCAIKELTSDENITVTYNEDDKAENLKLYTKKLTDTDDEYKNIDFTGKIIDKTISPSDVKFMAYDISLLDESDNAVQPNNIVTVKIPCPSEYDEAKCRVYHVEENGTFTDMKVVYKNGYLVFETKHFGTYLLTDTELKEDENDDITFGDVNGDGEVDIKDSALIKRYLAGWEVEAEMNMTAADVDGDGDVSIKDSALIKRQLAGWE